jgi:hypothetical protein
VPLQVPLTIRSAIGVADAARPEAFEIVPEPAALSRDVVDADAHDLVAVDGREF